MILSVLFCWRFLSHISTLCVVLLSSHRMHAFIILSVAFSSMPVLVYGVRRAKERSLLERY